MEIEEIREWKPLRNILNEELYIDSLLDDHNGLNIIARNQGTENFFKFTFKRVIFYQNVDETYSLERLENCPLLSTRWPLFICFNSNYVKRLFEQSFQIISPKKLHHYIITHGDGIIDVISESEAIVSFNNR